MGDFGRVGVVTVTYNSAGVIEPFLRCVMAQTYRDFILYVVDNASTDETLQRLGPRDPRISVISNTANLGVAEGNNQGIRAALHSGCAYVLLVNNDTEFDKTLLEKLLAGIHDHGCDMATPKMVYFDEPTRIWAAGGVFLPSLANRSEHIGLDQIDVGQFDLPCRVQYTPTCCLLVHRRVFDRIGLMDPAYFVYVDDSDFLFRADRAGCQLYYLPGAKLLHKVGRLTGGVQSPFAIRFSTRNKVYFIQKH